MGKLSVLVSDFDDTLFFNKDAIISAAKDLYDTAFKEKAENYCGILNNLEIIIGEGKIPKDFNRKWKDNLYTLAYTTYSSRLLPNQPLIDYLKENIKEGNELIIMSARGEEFRKETEELLNKYGLTYKQVILPENHELRDEEWKKLETEKLSKRYDHLVLFEDKEENIRYIIQNLKPENVDFYLVDHSILKYIGH
ncbi:MAG: hypothetical protein ACP5MV_01145 [Candidatus Parvarchaeum sp.]